MSPLSAHRHVIYFNTSKSQTEVTKYQCVCGDDKTPDKIDQYIGSIPNSICIATFAYCRQQHPGSDSCVECGKLVPSQVAKAAASSTSSSSSSSTSAPSVTSAATSPTPTKGAAVKLGGEIGGVAMGVAAAVGMFLWNWDPIWKGSWNTRER